MSNQQHNNNNNRHRPPRGQQQPQAGMGYAGGMMPPMYQQQYMMQAAARGPDGQPRIQHNQEGQVPMAASGVPPRGYNPQYNPYMFNQAQYMSSQRPNGVPGAAPPIGDQQQQNSSTSSTNTGTGDKNGSRIANTNSPGFGPVRNGVPMGNMGMPGQAVPGIPMQYQQAAFNRPYMMYSNMPRGMMAANMGVQQQQKQQQTPIAPRKKKILEIVDPTTKQKIELPAQDSKKKAVTAPVSQAVEKTPAGSSAATSVKSSSNIEAKAPASNNAAEEMKKLVQEKIKPSESSSDQAIKEKEKRELAEKEAAQRLEEKKIEAQNKVKKLEEDAARQRSELEAKRKVDEVAAKKQKMEEDNIRREEEEKKKAAVADNDDDKTSSNIKIVSTKSSSGKIMFNITEMLKLKELCTEKPSELDKVSFEIIKVAPSLMKQHSGFGNKGSFKNKQGQNWQSGRGRGRAQQTSTIVVEKLKVSENAWKPSLGKTEDADPVDITVKKVNSILNKLTLEMFDSLSSKMLEIPITSMRMLAGVVGAIFDKALSEPKFGELYAMFCKKLVEYRKDKKWDFVKVIKQEDGQFYWTNAIDENDKEFELKGPYADKKDAEDKGRKATEFKRALLNRCQHEFEKENEIIAAVEKVAKLKEELETMKANKESDEKLSEIKVKIQESNYVALKTKRLRLGNIQFIGELYKLELLSDNVMHGCILKILYKEENNRLVHYIPEEDDLEVLIKLLTTMGSLFDGKNRGNSKKDASNFERMNQYCARLGEIANSGQIPLRQKFLILNFLELRKNHWKARHEELKAKTIAEIQKDAKKEAASKAQQSSINNSNHNRGGNNQNQQRSWNNNQNKGSQRGGMSIAGANTGMSTGAFGHKLGKPQGASTGLGGGIGKSSIGGRIGQSSSMRSIGARPGANNSPIGITRPSQTSSVGGRNISPIASSTQKTPKLSKEKAERRAEGFLNEWIINKDKNALTLDIKELLEEAGKEVGMACLFKKACFLLIDKHKTTNVAIPKALIHGFETKYITTRDFENALDEEIKATIDEDLPMAEAYIADMIALFYNENILKASSIALVCRKYIEVNKEDSEHLIKSLLGKIFRALKSKAEAKAKAEIDSFGLKGLLGGDENVVKEFLDKYFF